MGFAPGNFRENEVRDCGPDRLARGVPGGNGRQLACFRRLRDVGGVLKLRDFCGVKYCEVGDGESGCASLLAEDDEDMI